MSRISVCFIIVAVLLAVVGVPLLVAVARKSVLQQHTEKVVVVGIDGLGTKNIASTDTPNFDLLKLNGKYTRATIDPNSYSSGPNWAGMLTGHTSETSGVSDNACVKPKHETLFDIVPTAVFSQWETIKCYSDNIARYTKDTSYYEQNLNTASILDIMTGNESLVFVHIDVLDYESHKNGASSSPYKRALQEIDKTLLPIVVDYVDNHNATLILSADHGSDLKSTGHSWDTVPLIFYGSGVDEVNLPVLAESRDVYYYVRFLLGQ